MSLFDRAILGLLLWPLVSVEAGASSSCLIGIPVCLNRYDTVCGVGERCVDETSTCFDTFRCDGDGFVCKSELIETEKDRNYLRTKFDELANKCFEIRMELEKLKKEVPSTGYDVLLLEDQIDKMKACLNAAASLEDARQCAS